MPEKWEGQRPTAVGIEQSKSIKMCNISYFISAWITRALAEHLKHSSEGKKPILVEEKYRIYTFNTFNIYILTTTYFSCGGGSFALCSFHAFPFNGPSFTLTPSLCRRIWLAVELCDVIRFTTSSLVWKNHFCVCSKKLQWSGGKEFMSKFLKGEWSMCFLGRATSTRPKWRIWTWKLTLENVLISINQ